MTVFVVSQETLSHCHVLALKAASFSAALVVTTENIRAMSSVGESDVFLLKMHLRHNVTTFY